MRRSHDVSAVDKLTVLLSIISNIRCHKNDREVEMCFKQHCVAINTDSAFAIRVP